LKKTALWIYFDPENISKGPDWNVYLKMKLAVFILLTPLLACLLLILTCLSLTSTAQQQPTGPKYLFFLHNRFIEGHGPLDEHPSYGRAEYQEILARFRKDGFIGRLDRSH
jgi:hypothetical protein